MPAAPPRPLVFAALLPRAAAGCGSALDCSLNGECVGGRCACAVGWAGASCAALDLLPTPRDAGYHHTEGGRNVTSWGGVVLRGGGGDARWHMWASEITHHCGMDAWTTNSQVIHAVADTVVGPYRREGVVVPAWAHEPTVARGPGGEWVMWYTGSPPGEPPRERDCTAAAGRGGGGGGAKEPRGGARRMPTWMITAAAPDGPWSAPVLIPSTQPLCDTNLAGVVLPNGSVVGLWRNCNRLANGSDEYGSSVHRATARRWDDPASYVEDLADQLPEMWRPSITQYMYWPEDPHVWRDASGAFHAVLHHCYTCPAGAPFKVCGGHAYSPDGARWHYSDGGREPDRGGGTYGDVVEFTDGGSLRLRSRERPHVVVGADGVTPVALSTSAGLAGGAYTIVQPIRAAPRGTGA